MKLLFCLECQDIFKLDYEERKCKCGRVTGQYIDNTNAITNGRGISLAIGNGSLRDAIGSLKCGGNMRLHNGAVVMPTKNGPYKNLTKVSCWVRDNEGPTNPNTKVIKNDQ